MNQFCRRARRSSTLAVSSALNTQTKGVPVVVYNPLSIAREDVVEAEVSFPGGMPKAVRVTDPDGNDVPSQLSNGKVVFVAKAPSSGYAVYDVEPAESAMASGLVHTRSVNGGVSFTTLVNSRYRIGVDQTGDITSIFDKSLNKELLSAPMRSRVPIRKAGNNGLPGTWIGTIRKKAPRAFVPGLAKMQIVEYGAAREAIEISREAEGSKFIQTIRLSAGDAGNRVEIGNVIDWKIGETALWGDVSSGRAASEPRGHLQLGHRDDQTRQQ